MRDPLDEYTSDEIIRAGKKALLREHQGLTNPDELPIIYRVRYDPRWGTRLERVYRYEYFTRKPTNREVMEAFATQGVRIEEQWFQPRFSGMIRVDEIIPYF